MATRSLPKRPTMFLVSSVLVLAQCLFFISGALATFVITWPPYSAVLGVIVLPPAIIVAVCQYLAAFRGNAGAPKAAAVFVIIGGVAPPVFLVVLFVLGAVDGAEVLLPLVLVILPMLASLEELGRPFGAAVLLFLLGMGPMGCLAGWLNRRRGRQLEAAGVSEGDTLGLARFSLQELMLFVTVAAGIMSATTYFVHALPPQYAEHVLPEKTPFNIPENATDVCFCRNARLAKAYEFTIDEEGFRAWIEAGVDGVAPWHEDGSLWPIAGTYTIRRYHGLSPELTGPKSITIADGLYYEWRQGSERIYTAFDRETNRAYYYRRGLVI